MQRRITQPWLARRDTASPLGRRNRPRVEWLEGRPLLSLFVPTISIAGTTVTASSSSLTTATFTVSLSPPAPGTVSVDYATADGTAVSTGANPDYGATSGMLTFTAGQSTRDDLGPDRRDADLRRDQVVRRQPVRTRGRGHPRRPGYGNDRQPQSRTDRHDQQRHRERRNRTPGTNERFTISLSAPSAVATTVTYATADGTGPDGADANVNYAPVPPPGDPGSAPDVAVLSRSRLCQRIVGNPPILTFSVNLLDATGAAIASGTGTVAAYLPTPDGHGGSRSRCRVLPRSQPAASISSSDDGDRTDQRDHIALR